MKIKPKILGFLILFSITMGAQNTILWKVSDTVYNKTSFWVGSFHQFGNSFVDAIPELKENLYASDLAIFETIDDPSITSHTINSRPASQINKELKKSIYTSLLKISQDWNVKLNKMKASEIIFKQQQEITKHKCKTVRKNDKWDHFDRYLEHLVENNNIKVLGLEKTIDQLAAISGNSKENWKGNEKNINSLIKYYLDEEFDYKKCTRAINYSKFKIDYKLKTTCSESTIFKDRNNKWMEQLPDLLSNYDCFIVVGYGHFAFECGIIEQLRSKGFMIEAIKLKPTYFFEKS